MNTRSVQRNDLISVIMPCFNAQRFVGEAVASVFSQSDVNVELIAVDDGSTDGSRAALQELARQYSGSMTVLTQDNKGPYPARNLALKHSRGGLVAFLDADDYWAPNCLKTLMDALRGARADLAYCGWQNVGTGGPGTKPYVPPRYEAGDVSALFLKGCPWPIHAAIVRRSVVDAVRGFSERYRTSMDYDFWLRISAVTRNFVQVPEVLAFYRWHDGGQISSVRWEQVLDSWSVRRDFIREHPDAVAQMSRTDRRAKVDGFLLSSAYNAYWKRDLVSAQRLFRRALATGYWKLRDLRYLVPSLLPGRIYRLLLMGADRYRQGA
jgi:glycosyltransferase involved in cell wall biosynthesis